GCLNQLFEMDDDAAIVFHCVTSLDGIDGENNKGKGIKRRFACLSSFLFRLFKCCTVGGRIIDVKLYLQHLAVICFFRYTGTRLLREGGRAVRQYAGEWAAAGVPALTAALVAALEVLVLTLG